MDNDSDDLDGERSDSSIDMLIDAQRCFVFSCFLLHIQNRLFWGWHCHRAWGCKLRSSLYKMP